MCVQEETENKIHPIKLFSQYYISLNCREKEERCQRFQVVYKLGNTGKIHFKSLCKPPNLI